jgi:hypothetical protein
MTPIARVLEKIFEVSPPTRRLAIEFGAGDGVTNSTVRRLFLHKGWRGLLIEGSAELAEECAESDRGID